MDYTQNLHLPQWEADDRIMRTDFNDAMQSIDAGVAAAATVTAQISALQSAMPRIATGSWTGNGGATRTISLPFTPKFVLVFGYYYANEVRMTQFLLTAERCRAVYHVNSYVYCVENPGMDMAIVTNGISTSATWGNYNNYTYTYVAIG